MKLKIVDDKNNRKAFYEIDNIEAKTRRSIRQGWFLFAKDLKQTASKDILKKPKGGKVYIVRGPGGRRRRHKASAPGETHANMRGELRRSLSWQVRGAEQMEFGYGVTGDAPEYAEYVEFGTRRMRARPSLSNTINKLGRNAENYFTQEFDREFK